MRVLLAILLLACTQRSSQTHIPALQPPAEGVPVRRWVPDWVEPSLLCRSGGRLSSPIFDRDVWRCPIKRGRAM